MIDILFCCILFSSYLNWSFVGIYASGKILLKVSKASLDLLTSCMYPNIWLATCFNTLCSTFYEFALPLVSVYWQGIDLYWIPICEVVFGGGDFVRFLLFIDSWLKCLYNTWMLWHLIICIFISMMISVSALAYSSTNNSNDNTQASGYDI